MRPSMLWIALIGHLLLATSPAGAQDYRGRVQGSIHQVTPAGDLGIAYVVRDDRAPWPAGRYVFRLAAADQAVDLAVCLVATP